MRVLGVRARAEPYGLVAGGELDIEPGDEGVDEVVAAAREGEVGGEGQVFGGDFVEVDGQDGDGVGDYGFHLYRVDEGFGERGAFEGGEVEAPDVVPDCGWLSARALLFPARCCYPQPIFSSLYSPSSIPATNNVALSG